MILVSHENQMEWSAQRPLAPRFESTKNIDHAGVVEVDKEPHHVVSPFHGGQQSGLVNPFDHLDAFEFNVQVILDQDAIGKLVDFHLRALRVLRGNLIPPKTAERQRLLGASRDTEYFPYQSSHTVAHQTR